MLLQMFVDRGKWGSIMATMQKAHPNKGAVTVQHTDIEHTKQRIR